MGLLEKTYSGGLRHSLAWLKGSVTEAARFWMASLTTSQDTTLLLWLPSVSQSLRRRLRKLSEPFPTWVN